MPATAKKNQSSLAVGQAAPDFELPTDRDFNVTLSSFKGEDNVVVYFYPKDDTPGCTLEAKDFRDLSKDFENADTLVIGISKDDIKSHCKFRDKYSLSFLLASDEQSDVCERYGVWVEKNMYGKKYMGIQRATFLIDKQGNIAQMWPKVSVDGHAKEVLEAAKNLA